MKRLHVIGRKNHGKTTLVVDLVTEFTRRGISVATVKHTHHHHELDVPGKDSHRHRVAGAVAVGILSPSMTAIYLPNQENNSDRTDRYAKFTDVFSECQIMIVEGDSQASAAKIEVWRRELGEPPLAMHDRSVVAVVTDDPVSITADILPRFDIQALADWILKRLPGDGGDTANETLVDTRPRRSSRSV